MAGLTMGPHRFGGAEIRVGRRELGHLRGNRLADRRSSRKTVADLISENRESLCTWMRSRWSNATWRSAARERQANCLLSQMSLRPHSSFEPEVAAAFAKAVRLGIVEPENGRQWKASAHGDAALYP
jgi:hypothetical protein